MKQFSPFTAYVPPDFLMRLTQWQMNDESQTEEEINKCYGECNKILADRISGTVCEFKPDIGYACEEINGTLCFEVIDDNTCIPVELLEDIQAI